MNKTIPAIFLATVSTVALADKHVNGYTRKDGTYVQPYTRSTPDSNFSNNYSSQGNTNPSTGSRGSERNEYSNPPAYQQSSPLYNPYERNYDRQRR